MIKYLLLFIVINSSLAMYLYSKSSNILFSSIINAPVASALLFFVDYLLLGYVDPFALFGFILTAIYCFVFSLAVLSCYKYSKDKLWRKQQ